MKEQLTAIKDYILAQDPVFAGVNGFIVEKYKDSGFHGFTDTIQNYFFLDTVQPLDREPSVLVNELDFSYDQGGKLPAYTGDFKLIAKFNCIDVYKVLKVLGNRLHEVPGVPVRFLRGSTDAQSIYFTETGKKLPENWAIVRIYFRLFDNISRCNLDENLCLEDCC